MFCPSCGTESTGLNFCNRCGTNLAALNAPTEIVQINLTKPAVLVGVVLAVLTLGGFALLTVGAGMLATVARGDDPLIALIFLGIVTILTVDILLIRQLSKLISAGLRTDGVKQPHSLPAAAPAQLPRATTAPFIPVSSVTENTTRFLEESHRPPVSPEPGREKTNT